MGKQDEQITNLRIALVDFQAHPRNYNEHPEAQIAELAESLKMFGQPKPVVVWKGYIVAGHGVFLAAQRLKWAALDARRLPDGWPEYKVTAYLAADNELARGASPNLLGLAQLAQEIRQEDEALARLAAGGEDGLRRLAEAITTPEGGEWSDAFGGLPSTDRSPFQQMTFTLHDTQVETVKRALQVGKRLGSFEDTDNANSNGNALALICETFVTNNG